MKHADDGEAFQPRQNAGGCWGHLRRDDGDLVAGHNAEMLRQFRAEDDAKFTRFQIRQLAGDHAVRYLRNPGLVVGQDTAQE